MAEKRICRCGDVLTDERTCLVCDIAPSGYLPEMAAKVLGDNLWELITGEPERKWRAVLSMKGAQE